MEVAAPLAGRPEGRQTMKCRRIMLITAGLAAIFYIRYLRTELEIARFDCRMKLMKERQRQGR